MKMIITYIFLKWSNIKAQATTMITKDKILCNNSTKIQTKIDKTI